MKNISPKQVILTVFNFLSLLSTVFGIYYSNVDNPEILILEKNIVEGNQAEIFGLIGFLSVVVITLVQIRISNKELMGGVEKAVAESLFDVRQRIDSSAFVRKTSLYEEEILEKVKTATGVRNTFVGTQGLDGKVSEPHKVYDAFFDREQSGKWVDIVGIRDFSHERYEKMSKNNTFDVFMLRHNPPLINFILLDFPGERPSEVYFGWMGTPRASTSKRLSQKLTEVFFTSNSDIVSFFSDYFERLIEDYTWGENSGPQFTFGSQGLLKNDASGFIDKSGWWITKLEKVDDEGKFSTVNYAFLRFNFDYKDRKDVSDIEVFLFDADKKYELHESHGPALAHEKNEVHFRWVHRRNLPTQTSGYCTYKFDVVSGMPKSQLGNEVLAGHVVTDPEFGDEQVGRLSGRRASEKFADGLEIQFPRKDEKNRTISEREGALSPAKIRSLERTLGSMIREGFLDDIK